VNRAFVKAYFGGDENPQKILGENLSSFNKHQRAVVSGVFDDERQLSVAQQSQPEPWTDPGLHDQSSAANLPL
jgi:hypothetical protein